MIDSDKIYAVNVTKFGQCGACKRKVFNGQTIEFLYDEERWKCRHR